MDASGEAAGRGGGADPLALSILEAPAKHPLIASMLAIIVLYRCSLQDSATWRSLHEQMKPPKPDGFRLLICANGVTDDERPANSLGLPADLPEWIEVVSVATNRGLSWAYDYALSTAKREGIEWLLTLDQDTYLPDGFLRHMQTRAEEVRGHGRIGAIVPRLVNDGGKTLSPAIAGWRERSVGEGPSGIVDGDVRAYNSGALIRVAALEQIGGYDRRFWLDYLDHSVFRALHEHGFQVWMESEIVLRHQLSLEDGREAMSEERFRNFATAEAAFQDLYVGWAGRLLYLGRLMGRAVNQEKRGDPSHFFDTTMRLIHDRVLVSRRERLRRWEASVAFMAEVPAITEHRGARGMGP